LVFCPKYRYRIFKGEVEAFTRQELYRLAGRKEGLEIVELNVQPDHIHLVMWIPPKYAASSIIGYLKGKLAIALLRRYERLSKAAWGRHLLARGYCLRTVGLNKEQIVKYVKWQEEKERQIEAQQGKLFE
jgi:putative transposase